MTYQERLQQLSLLIEFYKNVDNLKIKADMEQIIAEAIKDFR